MILKPPADIVWLGGFQQEEEEEVLVEAAPSIPSLVLLYNDGRLEPGNWDHGLVGSAPGLGAGGWRPFLTRLDRWVSNLVTPAEAKEMGCGVFVHNPFGRLLPMDLEAFSKVKQLITTVDGKTSLENTSVDAIEMVYACSDYIRDGGWLAMYSGGETVNTVLPGETPVKWANRMQNEIQPLLDITPKLNLIGFDHSLGENAYPNTKYEVVGGPFGGFKILIDRVKKHCWELAVEASRFVDAEWLDGLSCIVAWSLYKNKSVTGWFANDQTKTVRAVVPPKDMARTYMIVKNDDVMPVGDPVQLTDIVKQIRTLGFVPVIYATDFHEDMLA